MLCPQCQHDEFKVLDTRPAGDGIRRRRQCQACSYRFNTTERVELRLPLVVKKDGTREPFDRDKILSGLSVACRKRPISAGQIDALADRVTTTVISAGGEVTSADVGTAVLEELGQLDPVAYVRFASVYLELDSPKEIVALLEPWIGRRVRRRRRSSQDPQ